LNSVYGMMCANHRSSAAAVVYSGDAMQRAIQPRQDFGNCDKKSAVRSAVSNTAPSR